MTWCEPDARSNRGSLERAYRTPLRNVSEMSWLRPWTPGSIDVRAHALAAFHRHPLLGARGCDHAGRRSCSATPFSKPAAVKAPRREGASPSPPPRGGRFCDVRRRSWRRRLSYRPPVAGRLLSVWQEAAGSRQQLAFACRPQTGVCTQKLPDSAAKGFIARYNNALGSCRIPGCRLLVRSSSAAIGVTLCFCPRDALRTR